MPIGMWSLSQYTPEFVPNRADRRKAAKAKRGDRRRG